METFAPAPRSPDLRWPTVPLSLLAVSLALGCASEGGARNHKTRAHAQPQEDERAHDEARAQEELNHAREAVADGDLQTARTALKKAQELGWNDLDVAAMIDKASQHSVGEPAMPARGPDELGSARPWTHEGGGRRSPNVSPEPEATPIEFFVVKLARKRLAEERKSTALMIETPVNENNINAYSQLMEAFRSMVKHERESFSEWCANQDRRRMALEGLGKLLTSDVLYADTGQPDGDDIVRGSSGNEGRVWSWSVTGPLTRAVLFNVVFVRPANAPGAPWVFQGCSWCASGSTITTKGCLALPWKP